MVKQDLAVLHVDSAVPFPLNHNSYIDDSGPSDQRSNHLDNNLDLTKSCIRKLASNIVKFVISGSLHSKTEFHEVIPYGKIYTVHPATIAATPHGFKFVSTRADPYTSKLGDVMKARLAK